MNSSILKIFIPLTLILYLSMVSFTRFSLLGYYPDFFFTFILSIISLSVVLIRSNQLYWKNWIPRSVVFIAVLWIIGIGINKVRFPRFQENLNVHSFYTIRVDGRTFNAYFQPVGSYRSGYGSFWITENKKYFPIIEWQVYYCSISHYDFSDENWDGQGTKPKEVFKNIIREEIIEKGI